MVTGVTGSGQPAPKSEGPSKEEFMDVIKLHLQEIFKVGGKSVQGPPSTAQKNANYQELRTVKKFSPDLPILFNSKDGRIPKGPSGVSNPWLQASAMSLVYIIMMEVAVLQMHNKMQELLQGVKDLLNTWEIAKEKGALIQDIHKQRATQYLAEALMSLTSAFISLASAAQSMRTPTKIKAKAKAKLAKTNPKARAGMAQKKIASNKKELEGIKGKGHFAKLRRRRLNKKIEREEQVLTDLKKGPLNDFKVRGASADKKARKSEQGDAVAGTSAEEVAQVAQDIDYIKDFEKIEVGYNRGIGEQSASQVQIIHMLNAAGTEFTKAINGFVKSHFEVVIGALERSKTELEGAEKILQNFWSNTIQSVKDISEAIKDLMHLVQQMMQAWAQVMGKLFGRG